MKIEKSYITPKWLKIKGIYKANTNGSDKWKTGQSLKRSEYENEQGGELTLQELYDKLIQIDLLLEDNYPKMAKEVLEVLIEEVKHTL